MKGHLQQIDKMYELDGGSTLNRLWGFNISPWVKSSIKTKNENSKNYHFSGLAAVVIHSNHRLSNDFKLFVNL